MFCRYCGHKLSENTFFCAMCGKQSGESILTAKANQTGFVAARCTYCSGSLNVDPSQEAAVCPFCNQAYIVDKAISNYNISLNGPVKIDSATISVEGAPGVENLLLRAEDFERKGNVSSAIAYYDRVLDIDFSNDKANMAFHRLRNDAFKSETVTCFFSKGVLHLRLNKIVFVNKKGKEIVSEFSNIKSVSSRFSNLILSLNSVVTRFNQQSTIQESLSYSFNGGSRVAKEWVDLIEKAMNGIYPSQI